jgi:hypothetical protein
MCATEAIKKASKRRRKDLHNSEHRYCQGEQPNKKYVCVTLRGTPTGIRPPDRPARSESLYRLATPAPKTNTVLIIFYPKHLKRISRISCLNPNFS